MAGGISLDAVGCARKKQKIWGVFVFHGSLCYVAATSVFVFIGVEIASEGVGWSWKTKW